MVVYIDLKYLSLQTTQHNTRYNQPKQVKVKPCLAKIHSALPPPRPQLLGLPRGGSELVVVVVGLSSTIKPSREDCLDNNRPRPPPEVSLEPKQPPTPSARQATTALARLSGLEVSILLNNCSISNNQLCHLNPLLLSVKFIIHLVNIDICSHGLYWNRVWSFWWSLQHRRREPDLALWRWKPTTAAATTEFLL